MTTIYDEKEIKSCLTASLEMFKTLRLRGMADRWLQAYQTPEWSLVPPEIQMYELLKSEVQRRQANAIKRLIRLCNLPTYLLSADFTQFRLDANRKLDLKLFTLLSQGDWMWREQPADLIVVGATGVGKSYFAACCLKRALAQNKSCYFVKASRLFTDLRIRDINGTIEQRKAELAKVKLLVLDDFLLEDMSETDLSDFLHIIEDRSNNKVPTIYTSQYPLSRWKERMKVSALTEAITDRLEHSAYQFLLQGPSQREKVSVIKK